MERMSSNVYKWDVYVCCKYRQEGLFVNIIKSIVILCRDDR